MTYSRFCLNTGDVNIKFVCWEMGVFRIDGIFGCCIVCIVVCIVIVGCSSFVVVFVVWCIESRDRCFDARRFDRIRFGFCISVECFVWCLVLWYMLGGMWEGRFVVLCMGM